jgi:hypothetical protein
MLHYALYTYWYLNKINRNDIRSFLSFKITMEYFMFKKVIPATFLASLIAFNATADVDRNHFESLANDLNLQQQHTLAELHEGYQIAQRAAKNDSKNEQSKKSVSFASAPALYYLEIKYVASADYPYWEFIPDNAFATSQNHGGNWLYVVTEEGGYANPPTRRMVLNGSILQLLQSDPILGSGNVAIGWRNYWGTSFSSTGGTANYQATSINSPWNTESYKLTIQ